MLLTRNGVLKLADLGVAKWLEGGTFGRTLTGSPPYMSPEQFRCLFHKEDYSFPTDIWFDISSTKNLCSCESNWLKLYIKVFGMCTLWIDVLENGLSWRTSENAWNSRLGKFARFLGNTSKVYWIKYDFCYFIEKS
jgi:serine/threonine protein kinase